ncbi:N-acetylmuramoyl-L-alanine amidase [Kaarinaea lacus]
MLGQATQVNGVRMWSSPEGTRVVFDVDRKVEHNVFVLKNPDRVVIDLAQTTFTSPVTSLDYSESLVKGIRTGIHDKNNLRVVLDMKSHVVPKTFLLNPTKQYGYRLVVDLDSIGATSVSPAPDPVSNSSLPAQGRDIVVAIDAGHGGEDPGAIGRRGTREKDVALSIARKLEALLRQEKGIRPVLIRSGDYYISLRGRIRKARAHKADLFISIHADAFRNGRAQGSSVYVLSQRGASSEAARWLAASENDADLIGGVSLDDKDDLLASVLLDLSQNATLAASMDVGERILGQLKRVGHVHKRQIEHAGFVVLKAPDVPSILVETGFISNRQEENQLRSHRHQQRIAKALVQGIKQYFNDNPPADTVLASAGKRQHLVAEGDTLSSIARRYRISPHQLQSANGLSSDKIKAGHTLIIPVVGGS